MVFGVLRHIDKPPQFAGLRPALWSERENGEARVVLQDIHSFEQAQETVALLKILALGNRQIEEGRVEPAAHAVRRLRQVRKAG